MRNDGKTYIWLPSVLTLNKVTDVTAAMINGIHSAIGKPTVKVGDLNPYYFDLNDLDMGGAPFTRDAELINGVSCAVCGPIENLGYLPLSYVQLIIAFGGEVESLPVWFQLDSIDVDCPFSTTTPKEKWATWGTFGESHKPVKLGAKWYRSSAVGASGDMMPASQWASQLGLSIITKAEFLVIQRENMELPK